MGRGMDRRITLGLATLTLAFFAYPLIKTHKEKK